MPSVSRPRALSAILLAAALVMATSAGLRAQQPSRHHARKPPTHLIGKPFVHLIGSPEPAATRPAQPARQPSTQPVGQPSAQSVGQPGRVTAPVPVRQAVQQQPGEVRPGGVGTVLVPLQAPAGESGDSASYQVETAVGIRLFGPSAGRLVVDAAGRAQLPLSFSVARDRTAGRLVAAVVTATWADGRRTQVEASVVVATVRRLDVALEARDTMALPGRALDLPYTLVNRGNAADTVRISARADGWIAQPDPGIVRVGAGQAVQGVVHVRVPEGAQVGDTHLLRLEAVGRGGAVRATENVGVVADAGVLPGLAHMPTTVLLGASAGADGYTSAGVAVNAAGEVATDTRLTASYRHAPQGVPTGVFRSAFVGPGLRLGLERPAWSLQAGRVYEMGTALTGAYLDGEGGQLTAHTGDLTLDGFLARPVSPLGFGSGGHLAKAEASAATGIGRLGLAVTDLARPADLNGSLEQSRGITARYGLDDGASHLSVDAGILSLRSASGATVTGPAADASFEYRATGSSLIAEWRHVPGALLGNSMLSDQLTLAGDASVSHDLGVQGWLYSVSVPSLDNHGSRSGGASLGIRWDAGTLRTFLSGNYRSQSSDGLAGPSIFERRTVSAGVTVPLGSVGFDGGVEVGTGRDAAGPHPIRDAHGSLQWSGEQGWASATATYFDEYGSPWLQLDLSGSLRLTEGLRGEGGLSVSPTAPAPMNVPTGWAGARLDLARNFMLVVGLDYRPWVLGSSPWMTSIGIQRRLNVPLPIPRPPVVDGVVYEDLNGNDHRDPGEPGVPGVLLRLGRSRAITDAHGRFAFTNPQDRGAALRVDAASLASGIIVPASAYYPSIGHADIPVIRTASLTVGLFLDDNGNGHRDAGETVAPKGTVLTIRDAHGRTRVGAADADGHVVFDALPPGHYTLTVEGASAYGITPKPTTLRLQLAPGASLIIDAPVPVVHRAIRIGAGAGVHP